MASKKIAVIIHLFYLDNWPLFKDKLNLLKKYDAGIYVTMPKQHAHFEESIQKAFPGTTIIIVKNKGRDVLPFLVAARRAIQDGYGLALKFHSKKSTHRTDGQEWLETMLNQIIPEEPGALKRVVDAVRSEDFGVLGPKAVYYPLTINFPANGAHLTRIISREYGFDVAHKYLQVERSMYGFFGGTMLWVNLNAIKPLFSIRGFRFEREAGQIDGTLAHAIERALCVVPQIQGLGVYESDGRTVKQRPYSTDNIPDWSEDHDK